MTTEQKKKICFIISPIGEEYSETRRRSDSVLKHIITEPVEYLGYKVIRADKISKPGIITTQIIHHIVDDALVIADLTEGNPNVFYELAIRHAIRKPLVQLIKKGDPIPFDVAGTRIIQFDIHNLDSVSAAKGEISSQVKSLETGESEVHNPISASLDLIKILKEKIQMPSFRIKKANDLTEFCEDLASSIFELNNQKLSKKLRRLLVPIMQLIACATMSFSEKDELITRLNKISKKIDEQIAKTD